MQSTQWKIIGAQLLMKIPMELKECVDAYSPS